MSILNLKLVTASFFASEQIEVSSVSLSSVRTRKKEAVRRDFFCETRRVTGWGYSAKVEDLSPSNCEPSRVRQNPSKLCACNNAGRENPSAEKARCASAESGCYPYQLSLAEQAGGNGRG